MICLLHCCQWWRRPEV